MLGLVIVVQFSCTVLAHLNTSGIAEVERHETRAADGESR
jgi:hypothetical protein